MLRLSPLHLPLRWRGLHRDELGWFPEALRAEGIPASPGYTPLYKARAIQKGVSELRHFVEGHPAQYVEPHRPATERACSEEGLWLRQTMLLGDRNDMDDILAALAKIQRAKGRM